VDPPLSASDRSALCERALGWIPSPSGSLLFWPSGKEQDPFDGIASAVAYMNSVGSSVRGEVRWVGEDGASASIAVTDEGPVINTDDQSLSDMEIARLIASLRNDEESQLS